MSPWYTRGLPKVQEVYYVDGSVELRRIQNKWIVMSVVSKDVQLPLEGQALTSGLFKKCFSS